MRGHLIAALQLRAAYIVEHASAIYVRVKAGPNTERMDTFALSELHGAEAIREAFRLLLRDETPYRTVFPEVTASAVIKLGQREAGEAPTGTWAEKDDDPKGTGNG